MFNYLDKQKQMRILRHESEFLKSCQERVETATSIVFVTLAESGKIDDITATEHSDLFVPWVVGVAYPVGVIRRHNDILYKCIQQHTSQEDWSPDVTPSLWVRIGDPTEEYPEWSRPIGSHDAYTLGDKVTYDGQHWISVVENNVWQPGIYGWEVTE